MDKIRALIVDDEPLAREMIVDMLVGDAEVEIIGECGDGLAAVAAVETHRPDLVFLDVQIPEMNGFAVLREVSRDNGARPLVVFVTAYDEYALEGFEVNALDYLLKPFDDERFGTALERARERIRQQQGRDLDRRLQALLENVRGDRGYLRRLVVPSGHRSIFVRTEHIDWIEAERNYVRLHAGGRSHLLRENLTRIEEAVEVSDHYHRVIDLVQKAGLDAQISVKPTQLGYDQDPDVCFKYCAALLDRCDQTHNILWLDMESSKYVDGTIALYQRLRERSPAVGIAIQAYLYRTEKDIDALVPLGAAIRLVKGAYLEPPDVAYPKKSDVDENYYKLAERLLRDDAAKPGALVHFGTHDIPLQERILKVIRDRNVPKERYEIAMLYGIQTSRQTELMPRGGPRSPRR